MTDLEAKLSTVWSATTQFRWQRRKIKLHPFYKPDTAETLVLQQMYQGSDGTVRWADVPIEDEEAP